MSESETNLQPATHWTKRANIFHPCYITLCVCVCVALVLIPSLPISTGIMLLKCPSRSFLISQPGLALFALSHTILFSLLLLCLSHNLFTHLSSPLASSRKSKTHEILLVNMHWMWKCIINCKTCSHVPLLCPVMHSRGSVQRRPNFCQIPGNRRKKKYKGASAKKYVDKPNPTNLQGTFWTLPNCAHFDLLIESSFCFNESSTKKYISIIFVYLFS